MFVTTHYLDEAEHCHRLALIHAGRLVALGTVAELKEVFAGPRGARGRVPARRSTRSTRSTRRAVGAARPRSSARGCTSWSTDAEAEAPRSRSALERGRERARRVERIVPSLEDVFIHHVRGGARPQRRGRVSAVRKIWAVARKELRQIARDPLSLLMLLGAARVHARALRLRAQLRRAPRARWPCRTCDRAGAQPRAAWPRSSTRPTSTSWPSAERRRRPRAAHRARGRPRPCS